MLFFLAIFIINSITLTGCWNYKEVDDLATIAGIAFDKNDKGKYVITAEIVGFQGSGRDTKIKSKLIESYGDTIVDATRNLLKIISPRPYYGHLEVVIISQKVAQEGIIDILDSLNRYREVRLTLDILVSEGKTAKEILDSQIITLEIHSFDIQKMLDSQIALSKVPRAKVYEIVNALSGEGISPVLPAIRLTENQGEKTTELSGSAVFNKDKLIGFLNGDETKSLLFIRDKIKGGVLVVKKSPENGSANVTLDIKKNKTKVKPVNSNGKESINIKINTIVDLFEYNLKQNLLDEKGSLILKRDSEKMLKTNIENLILKVQKDYEADVFGFGNTIYRDMPLLWKKIKSDWNNIFRSLDVNVSVNIDIRNLGLISKPIKKGD